MQVLYSPDRFLRGLCEAVYYDPSLVQNGILYYELTTCDITAVSVVYDPNGDPSLPSLRVFTDIGNPNEGYSLYSALEVVHALCDAELQVSVDDFSNEGIAFHVTTAELQGLFSFVDKTKVEFQELGAVLYFDITDDEEEDGSVPEKEEVLDRLLALTDDHLLCTLRIQAGVH